MYDAFDWADKACANLNGDVEGTGECWEAAYASAIKGAIK